MGVKVSTVRFPALPKLTCDGPECLTHTSSVSGAKRAVFNPSHEHTEAPQSSDAESRESETRGTRLIASKCHSC